MSWSDFEKSERECNNAESAMISDSKIKKEITHHFVSVNTGKIKYPITAHFTKDVLDRAVNLGLISHDYKEVSMEIWFQVKHVQSKITA